REIPDEVVGPDATDHLRAGLQRRCAKHRAALDSSIREIVPDRVHALECTRGGFRHLHAGIVVRRVLPPPRGLPFEDRPPPPGVRFGPSARGRWQVRLDGKVALITGGGSGMGKVASELFAAEGASVVLTDVNDEAGEATATAIGDAAAYIHADVSKESDAEAMVASTVERFGRLDVLYNNAGIMPLDDGSITDADGSIWDAVFSVNVKGVAFGCKYGIPAMIDSGGGSVINVASFVAWLGAATSQTAYTASKGAVLAMTREIAVEYARKG